MMPVAIVVEGRGKNKEADGASHANAAKSLLGMFLEVNGDLNPKK